MTPLDAHHRMVETCLPRVFEARTWTPSGARLDTDIFPAEDARAWLKLFGRSRLDWVETVLMFAPYTVITHTEKH